MPKQHLLLVIVSDQPNATPGRQNLTVHDDVLSVSYYKKRWALHKVTEQVELPLGHAPVSIHGIG